jgi:hypothetical protein
MSSDKNHFTRYLQCIDDDTIQSIMDYFQMDDYDVFIRYVSGIGIKKSAD